MKRFVYIRVDTNILNWEDMEEIVYAAILASSVNCKISARFEHCSIEKSETDSICILAMNDSDEKFEIKEITTPEELCDDGAIYLLSFDSFEDYARARAKLENFEHTSILVEQHKSTRNKEHVVIPEKQPQIGRRYTIPNIPDVSEVNEKKEESTKKNSGNLISNIFTFLFLLVIVAAIIGIRCGKII